MFAAVLSSGSKVPPESVRMLLSVCSPIVAADAGLGQLRGTGVSADYLIGDMDSLTADDRAGMTGRTQVVQLSPSKDDSDTDAAVALTRRCTGNPIILIGGTGGRMDHWLSNLRLFDLNDDIHFWLAPEDFVAKLQPGQVRKLRAGRISFFPTGTGPWNLSGTGLRWPVDRVEFSHGHSLSNEVETGGGNVVALQGRFLVIEPTSGAILERLG